MLAFLLLGAQMFAGSGGPDTYGYTWKDSNEPNHSYSWVEISNKPDAVLVPGLADDNSVGPFNIGWDFQYYWVEYNSVKIGSNGWFSFDNVGNIASCFPTVPTPGGAGDNIVATYMSDLTFISNSPANPNPGEMYYWTNNADTFIIQWNNVGWWQQGSPDWVGDNTFQVILSGVDSSITMNYMDTDVANFSPGTACPTYMEIGIENLTGNIGLGVFSGTTLPADNFSIKFEYPDTVLLQVPDATPAWNANSDNAGQFYFINQNIDMQANIASVGNADITQAITVNGSLQNLQFNTVWSDQASIANGITAGNNQTVTFPTQANITAAGQYYYNVTTAASQDLNPSNNNNIVEVSAVESVNGRYNLTYASLNNPDGSISWAGGGVDDGVAVEYFPPDYPYTIDSFWVWIVGDGDPNTPLPVGYRFTIVDSFGGNVLYTDSFPPSAINEDGWNYVALSAPVVINSGKFICQWLQGGTGIAIGTEAFGPISRRTYEILGGTASPYRQNTVEDMLIAVAGQGVVAVDDPTVLDNALRAYPNPNSTGLLNIDYDVPALGDIGFRLMNTVGQTVWEKTHTQIPAGTYNFNIETGSLNAGVYFLDMEQQGQRTVKKIVIQ